MAATTRSQKRQRSEEESGSERPRKQQKTGSVEGPPSSPPLAGSSPPGSSPPGAESEDVPLPLRPRTVRPRTRQSRPSPVPDIPDFVTTDWSDSMSEVSSDIDPSNLQVKLDYQSAGAQYQAWIDGPTIEHCSVMKATLTYNDLFSLPPAPNVLFSGDQRSFQWVETSCSDRVAYESVAEDGKTVGLSTGNDWNRRVLRQLGWAPQREVFKWSEYIHWVVEGAIVAVAVMRYHGPHWSEIALAHYTHVCPDINTLKYVYVADIINKETAPYVRKILYNDEKIKPTDEPAARYWVYDSDEYQCLLGTAIGKGVASMVLGAWSRGTHRIKQIKSYFESRRLQLRFDIVEIGSESSASGEKSSEEEEMDVEKVPDSETDEAEMDEDQDVGLHQDVWLAEEPKEEETEEEEMCE
ncbi:unnamed protein product [Penicillium salamii]|nr:unnamed protein product [Penicillium salamii]CAG8361879.1 unnamed protein product [Penicillium salamii]